MKPKTREESSNSNDFRIYNPNFRISSDNCHSGNHEKDKSKKTLNSVILALFVISNKITPVLCKFLI